MKIIQKILLTLNMLVLMATLLAYLSPYVDPNDFWIPSFFGLFYPVFFILNVLFVLFWLFNKVSYTWFSLLCLLLGWNHVTNLIGFHPSKVVKDNVAIEVVSYNIQRGMDAYVKNERDQKKTSEQMQSFIKQFESADILCVQEISQVARDIFDKSLGKRYVHGNPKRGTAIYSKHPIVDKGEIDFGTWTNSCLWADIVVNFDTIRFYSVHLQSNKISVVADKVVKEMDLQTKKTWSGIRNILGKYRESSYLRAKQAKRID